MYLKSLKYFIFFIFVSTASISQTAFLEINPIQEKKFGAYLSAHHGGAESLAEFKNNNRLLYAKELWYYSESFFVKRNHFASGVILDESIIDISRFEDARLDDQEALVVLPGFRDALILLPKNKLIYKP